MPAKFDRCVRKVKRRIKMGGLPADSSPYAICKAAIKRSSRRIRYYAHELNPIPMGHGAEHAVHWKPLLLILGAAVGVGALIALTSKPTQAAQSPKQQGGPALPPNLPPPPGESYAG
jgi:hypothetical protein